MGMLDRKTISAAQSKPESSRTGSGAFGPAALTRRAIGITRCRSSSVSLAECCTPGHSDNSNGQPLAPMKDDKSV